MARVEKERNTDNPCSPCSYFYCDGVGNMDDEWSRAIAHLLWIRDIKSETVLVSYMRDMCSNISFEWNIVDNNCDIGRCIYGDWNGTWL
jgi:hypothetical protein